MNECSRLISICAICDMCKMETCDISVVKEESVELIETEPQNEDKFDMCGQSGIKTEVGQASVNAAPIGGTFPRERHTIWQGVLEWIENAKNPSDPQKVTRHVPCQVSANLKDGEPELKADTWPQKLIMQLMPKQLIGNIGGAYLKNSKSVLFHPQNCEALDSLTRVMSSGFAGCVHFTSVPVPSPCEIKVLILLYTSEKRAYLGFIPNDQAAFVDRLRKVIQHQKTTQALMRQTQEPQYRHQVLTMHQMGGTPRSQQQQMGQQNSANQGQQQQQQQQQTPQQQQFEDVSTFDFLN